MTIRYFELKIDVSTIPHQKIRYCSSQNTIHTLFIISAPFSKVGNRGETRRMVRILIVEDSTFFRKLLKEALSARYPEIEISEAPNAEEALKKVNGFTPDLIFVDIGLPGESGLDLTRKTREMHPDIPIIILTSYDLPEYREAAMECQADHFLSKGTTTKKHILEMVKSIIEK